jgi:hypothetical protein
MLWGLLLFNLLLFFTEAQFETLTSISFAKLPELIACCN